MADEIFEEEELDDLEKYYRGLKHTYIGHYNKSLEMLKLAGSDFMKNKFDIALVVFTQDTNKNLFDIFDKDTQFFGEYAQKKMFADMAQFMVRTGEVEIPQMESDTFEVSFLFQKIKKVRSKVKFERKAQLKVRVDEPLFFNMFFNLLSNNNTISAKLGSNPIIFAPFSTNRIFKEDLKNKTLRIDMYVKHQSFMRMQSSNVRTRPVIFNDSLRAMNDYKNPDSFAAGMTGMQPDDLPFWFFENVRFLGQQDPITFKRDSAETLDMSYPFIFRRLVLISPQKRNAANRVVDPLNPSNMENSGQFKAMDDQSWYYDRGLGNSN